MSFSMRNSNHRRLAGLPALLGSLLLAACGGGGDNTLVVPPGQDPGGEEPPVAVSDLVLIASSNLLPSDGSAPVTVSAIVRNANNNVVEGVTVVFSADSGSLQVLQGTTTADGVAQAELTTAGDPTNREIVVTASAGGLTDTVTVNVSGTTLTLAGPDNVVQGDEVTLTAKLSNATGGGISGADVAVSSEAGNTLSAESLVTNSQGEATFQVTGTQGGADTITASALGISASAPLSVSADDSLVFIAPTGGQEIVLNTPQNVTVEWLVGGAPQTGTVNFSTTRGTLSAASAALGPDGRATVSIAATSAGPATLTARIGTDGPQTQRSVEFVATVPEKIDVQASRFTIGPGEQSTIIATVRDANDNAVKNKVVLFELTDVTGGSLSVGSAATDSSGRAQSVYTAGQTVSASSGVMITARVQENQAISGDVALTVARREVDVSIGTGNELFEPTTATYEREFVVQVTDSQGVGMAGVPVQLSVRSKYYRKGIYVEGDNNRWVPVGSLQDVGGVPVATPPLRCPDEDFNFNGQLDAGEDFNSSTRIEAGNAVSVSPGEIVTDDTGVAIYRITYAQEFGNWLEVTLTARASVQGTEFEDSEDHALEILAADAATSISPPGGGESRFGGDDTDASIDGTDAAAGSPRLIELGYPSGRPLGCRNLD